MVSSLWRYRRDTLCLRISLWFDRIVRTFFLSLIHSIEDFHRCSKKQSVDHWSWQCQCSKFDQIIRWCICQICDWSEFSSWSTDGSHHQTCSSKISLRCSMKLNVVLRYVFVEEYSSNVSNMYEHLNWRRTSGLGQCDDCHSSNSNITTSWSNESFDQSSC